MVVVTNPRRHRTQSVLEMAIRYWPMPITTKIDSSSRDDDADDFSKSLVVVVGNCRDDGGGVLCLLIQLLHHDDSAIGMLLFCMGDFCKETDDF